MERLTIDEVIEHCERHIARQELFRNKVDLENGDMESFQMKEYWEHRQVKEWLEELKKYKADEEQGLLLRVPCPIGTTVYALTPFCEICEEALDNEYACENCNKGKYVEETKFDYEMIPMVGTAIFLTEEEAEQKKEFDECFEMNFDGRCEEFDSCEECKEEQEK